MSYTFPSLRDQSYVMLVLATGVLKRSVPEMVVFNNFPEAEEKIMVDFGVKVMEGSASPESYIDKLESVVKKLVGKSIKFDDYIQAQLLGRLNLSRSATTINKTLDKQTAKVVKNDGTMKPMTEAEDFDPERFRSTDPVYKNDARYEALPEKDKTQVQVALHTMGLLQAFNEPVTTQKIDFLVKRLKKSFSTYSPGGKRAISRILTTLDSQDWKQLKPTSVKGIHLNSVIKEDELDEAKGFWMDRILDYVASHGGTSAGQMFSAIGRGHSQLGFNKNLYQALDKGYIRRDMSSRPYKYFSGNAPSPKAVKPTPVAKKPEVAPVAPPVAPTATAGVAAPVVDVLKAKPGITFVELLHALNVVPKSAKQIAVFNVLKAGLAAGAIRREKDGASFKYYVGTGEPTMTRAKVTKGPAGHIVDVLKKKPGIGFVDLLHTLGVVPKSAGQIKVFAALKQGLLSGAIRREKDGLSYKYYVGKGIPTVMKTINRQPKAAKVPASQKKKEAILNMIESDSRSFLGRPDDTNKDDDSVTLEFRHLGDWIDDEENSYEYDDPDSDEYAPDWREDNDNRIWAPGEYTRYFKKFKEWAARYPWRKYVDLELNTSEKDWCYFTIQLKRKK